MAGTKYAIGVRVAGRKVEDYLRGMDLNVLLEPKVDLAHVARILNELGPSGRLDTIRGWDRSQQAAIYEAAKGFSPLDLDYFVPKAVGPRIGVVHHGKGTSIFNHFEKRICRPDPLPDGSGVEELWGYTHNDWQVWTGPGYFVAYASENPGEVALDHTRIPERLAPAEGGPPDRPEGWPAVLPSSARLGRFIDDGTVDVMRGISKHVSIGRARRKTKWTDQWCVLCREDAD
jgi:hypothetical protein